MMKIRSAAGIGVVYLAFTVLCPAGTGIGQSVVDPAIDEMANKLAASEPRISALAPADRKRLVEFILGNTLFTLSHELGQR